MQPSIRNLLLLLSMAPLLVPAQGYLAPQARWEYVINSIPGSGGDYVKGSISWDSTIYLDGLWAQRLRNVETRWWPDTANYFEVTRDLYYASIGDMVMTRASDAWDTLYRFDAVPGDHWYAPGFSPEGDGSSCDPLENRLVVTDTGHVIVQGINLRTLTLLNYVNNDPQQPLIRTIPERICFPLYRLEGGCSVIICSYTHVCNYSDMDIQLAYANAPWTGGCDPLVTEVRAQSLFHLQTVLHGASGLEISSPIPVEAVDVQLYDAMGKLITHRANMTLPSHLPTSHLTAGTYVLHVASNDGSKAFRTSFVILD